MSVNTLLHDVPCQPENERSETTWRSFVCNAHTYLSKAKTQCGQRSMGMWPRGILREIVRVVHDNGEALTCKKWGGDTQLKVIVCHCGKWFQCAGNCLEDGNNSSSSGADDMTRKRLTSGKPTKSDGSLAILICQHFVVDKSWQWIVFARIWTKEPR